MTVIKQHNGTTWVPVLVGAGVPPGGAVGQVVGKASVADYDTEWVDAGAGGGLDQATADTLYLSKTGDDVPTAEYVVRAITAWGDPTAESVFQHLGCDYIWINQGIQIYKPIYLDGTGNVPTDPRHATSKSYVDGAISTHIADTTAVHGIADTTLLETTTGATAKVTAHTSTAVGAHAATAISYAGSTNLAATTVEAALDELDAEKQPLDADLTAIAGLTATTGNIIQSVGSTWASQTPTQVKAALAIASTDVSGLGSLATKSTIASADITDNTVANNDLATMAANTVKMNNTGGVAAPTDVTVANLLTALGLSVPVTVAQGGSGRNTATTAYGLLAAGTTATGIQQTVTPAASGFLKTTSATALPAWTAIAQADVTNLVNDLSNKQPLDSDLSAIAILAHATNSMIQSNGSAWIAATPTQVKTGLAITKTDVGLGNVDNTSDANKLISTATQTALDAKQPLDADLTAIAGLAQSSGSTLQSNGTTWIAATPSQAKTALALTKSDVGLDQVTNTSDVNKPVSTAQAAADLLKADKTTTISVTAPITGGGDLSANRTIGVNTFGTSQAGVVPQSGGGTANYLHADGSWAPPPGSGGLTDGDKGEVTVTAGVWSIDADVVTNAKLANMAANSFKGNNTGSVADPLDLSVTEAKALLAMTKSDVGLSNVDNTSDANKPVSTAQATANALALPKAGGAMTGTLFLNGVDLYGRSSDGLTNYARLSMTNTETSLIGQVNRPVVLNVGGAAILTAAATLVTSTMPIALPADPASNLHAATKQYVDTQRDTRQPLDTDLTALAGLTATTGNMILSAGSAWTSATPATVKTALALNNVDNTSDANKPVSTAQATADGLRVLKAGDTMTGSLIVSGPSWDHVMLRGSSQSDVRFQSTAPVDWALVTATASNFNIQTFPTSSTISFTPNGTAALSLSKTQVQANLPVMLLGGAPTDIAHATRKDYVDTQDALKVAKAGDTMTDTLTIDRSTDSGAGLSVKAPTTPAIYLSSTGGLLYGMVRATSSSLQLRGPYGVKVEVQPNAVLTTTFQESATTSTVPLYINNDVARMELKSAAGVGRAIFGSDALGPYITAVVGAIDMIVDSESKLNVADAVITSTVPIVLPGAPTSALHAATKQYVDDNAGGGGGSATWTGTQAAFDALVTLDVATFYYVVP